MRVLHKCSITLFILTLLLSSHAFAKDKLVFAIDLIRHGDRTPLYESPNSPTLWKEGPGELTSTGMHQEIGLGKDLRKKYVGQTHLLPERYEARTFYVRSTDVHRTIMSADMVLAGLYPQNTRASSHEQIPIYIVPWKKDNLLVPKKGYSMGKAFLKEVTHYLELASQGKTPLKLILFSAHDSTIMAVMSTLGSPLGTIPGYASDLNFSLYQNNKKYYVIIRYNNKPVLVPACGGSTCTLSQLELTS